MTSFELVFAAAGVLLVLTLAWRMPRLTRPDLFFGVTVQAGLPGSPAGREVVRRYRSWLLAHTVVAVTLALIAARFATPGALAGVAWLTLGWFFSFLGARRRVLPRAVPPTSVREADLAPRPARLPGGWALQLLPFAALAATALYLRSRWTDLPERFPVQWGPDGGVSRWAARDFAGVWAPLATAAAVAASLALLAWLLQRFSRRTRTAGAAGEAENRYRRSVLGVVLATEYLLTAVVVWSSLLPFSGATSPPPLARVVLVPLVLTFLFVAAVSWVLMRLGQGGSRRLPAAATASPPGSPPVGDRSPDRCWKGGILYLNREDPALFVEKRFGLGYTLNLARPAAWIILAAMVLLPLLLTWWLVVTQ